jgi:hypothetical protein
MARINAILAAVGLALTGSAAAAEITGPVRHRRRLPDPLDLDDDDRVELREATARDRYFVSPRVKRLRADCGGAMVSIGDRAGRC